MQKAVIAANWKMHGNQASLSALTKDIIAGIGQSSFNANIILFPPFPYISIIGNLLKATGNTTINLGAQNVSAFTNGAYTGDVSAEMLSDIGCSVVLIGHSERRHIFHESDAEIAKKYQRLHERGLTTMLCVGETEAQRNAEETIAVLTRQLDAVLSLIEPNKGELDNFMLAYEPVWAIGTGQTATAEQVQEVHTFIRSHLAKVFSSNEAKSVKILYGGSVKAHNARSLLDLPDVDGTLVGGASLQAQEFLEIIQCSKLS